MQTVQRINQLITEKSCIQGKHGSEHRGFGAGQWVVATGVALICHVLLVWSVLANTPPKLPPRGGISISLGSLPSNHVEPPVSANVAPVDKITLPVAQIPVRPTTEVVPPAPKPVRKAPTRVELRPTLSASPSQPATDKKPVALVP
ncbi:MAG: hypothetical protein KJO08_08380, partial [Gammaproteobacteria bacterium]|nr:hypothetical protein [Gammaproteobacteria bacterium]NNJ84822.1 hypothetical protein [Gammaproteobacteria bacterium]